MQLAQESSPFLSTRRCRHFLASIAPRLLRAVAETPDPDMALVNLEKVTASLGAKAVLWELFSFNPPSLKLYVDLCAWSQFLSEILINNPGMIDELLDSLVLNQPRTADELRQELADLCRGAADLEPILHSFQDKELLRIGVRDILGKDTIQATTADAERPGRDDPGASWRRCRRGRWRSGFGVPYLTEGRQGGPAQPVRAAGAGQARRPGVELSQRPGSDPDLRGRRPDRAAAGRDAASTASSRPTTSTSSRSWPSASSGPPSYLGPLGRLYQVDMRLRPTGKSGSLVLPLGEFRRYFAAG